MLRKATYVSFRYGGLNSNKASVLVDVSREFGKTTLQRVSEMKATAIATKKLTVARGRYFGAKATHTSDPITVASKMAALFAKHDVKYALGGALAHSFWAKPRATVDVDMNVFVPATEVDQTLQLLLNNGATFFARKHPDAKVTNLQHASKLTKDNNNISMNIFHGEVDLFFPRSDNKEVDLCWLALSRTKSVPFGKQNITLLDAESITIFKLLWGRTKDIADLELMFAARGKMLDFNYILSTLRMHANDDDPSLRLFFQLKREFVDDGGDKTMPSRCLSRTCS